MRVVDGLGVALGSLLAAKLRSGLTMLGIIIGIAAVIVLLSIGQGMQAALREEIERIGTNLITVFPGGERAGSIGGGSASGGTLTDQDAQAIAGGGTVTAARAVSPELGGAYRLAAGPKAAMALVTGVVPAYQTVHTARLARGEFIGEGHVAAAGAVIVLGPKLAMALFGEADPIGRTVQLTPLSGTGPRLALRVVGVLAPKGGGGLGSLDDQALVPLTTMQRKLTSGRPVGAGGGRAVSSIAITALDEQRVALLEREVTALLRERHRLTGPDNDFRIFNQTELLASANQMTGVVTAFLGAVAGISLLVGGIGIMNIMLVSVTERTREIGVRKAVGARQRDILSQFLLEALALSTTAGLLGILVGLIGSRVAVQLGQRSDVALATVGLALGVASAIGLLFGLWPAWRASRLHPIDALRYE